MRLKINIEDIKGFTLINTNKIKKAGEELEIIVNGKLFRKMFLAADFNGETSTFKNWTRTKLFDYMMTGAEVLNPVTDNTANIAVKAYYTFRGVIGYTKHNIKHMYLNVKFMGRPRHKIAATLMHEWGHKLGFGHDFRRTYRRQFSICYQLGTIVEVCYAAHFPHAELNTPTKRNILSRIGLFFKNLF